MSKRKPKYEVNILKRFADELAHPRLGEKIDYAYRISKALEAIQLAILGGDPMVIDNSISALFALIPESWYDEEFSEDISNARVTYEEETQSIWCGIPWGNSYVETKENTEKFLVLLACINLLDRLDMLARKEYREVVGGVPFGQQNVLFEKSEGEEEEEE